MGLSWDEVAVPQPQASQGISWEDASKPPPGTQPTMGFWDRLGSGFVRGARNVIDYPAELLAKGGDALGITGGMLPTSAQVAQGNQQARADYAANPANQSPAGEFLGETAMTLPAVVKGMSALRAAGPVGEFLAGSGGSGVFGRAASGAASGGLFGGLTGAATDNGAPLADRAMTGAATGAAFGGAFPMAFEAGRGIRNWATGASALTPERAELARTAIDQYGIPLTAQDIMPGMPASKWLGSALDYLPFSGASGRREQLQQAVNRAVSGTFGGDEAGQLASKVTGNTMEGATRRIGSLYDEALKGVRIPMDDVLTGRLAAIRADLGQSALADNEIRAANAMLDKITQAGQSGGLTGEFYQEMRQFNSALDKAAKAGGPAAEYARDIRGALNDAFERNAPEVNVNLFKQANQMWRALKGVEPEVSRGMPGDIRPGMIQNAANRAYPGRGLQGEQPPLGEIGDISKAFLGRLPESGTAPRVTMMEMIKDAATKAAGVGAPVAGASAAGVGIVPAIAGTLGVGRAVNSALNSQWLRNALLNSALNPGAPTAFERALLPYAPYAAPFGALTIRPSGGQQ